MIDKFMPFQLTPEMFFFISGVMFIFLILKYIYRLFFPKRVSRKYRKLQLQQIKQMNWESFEKMVQELFCLYGYRVIRKGGRGADGGVDLLLYRGKETSMVQCKRYKGNVGVKIVREMYAVGIDRGYDKIYICTSAKFTKEAKIFARGKNIILKDGEQILSEIRSKQITV